MVGFAVKSDLDGVIKMVRSLSLGSGLDPEKVAKYGEFYTKVAESMAYFYKYMPIENGSDKVKSKGLLKMICGPPAMAIALKDAERRVKDGDGAMPAEMKNLRMYDWALDEMQRELRETIMKALLPKLRSMILAADVDSADEAHEDDDHDPKASSSTAVVGVMTELQAQEVCKKNLEEIKAQRAVPTPKGKKGDKLGGGESLNKFFKKKTLVSG